MCVVCMSVCSILQTFVSFFKQTDIILVALAGDCFTFFSVVFFFYVFVSGSLWKKEYLGVFFLCVCAVVCVDWPSRTVCVYTLSPSTSHAYKCFFAVIHYSCCCNVFFLFNVIRYWTVEYTHTHIHRETYCPRAHTHCVLCRLMHRWLISIFFLQYFVCVRQIYLIFFHHLWLPHSNHGHARCVCVCVCKLGACFFCVCRWTVCGAQYEQIA